MMGTLEGVVCARCSHWKDGQRVQVRHANVEAVRNCTGPGPIPLRNGKVKSPTLPSQAERKVERAEAVMAKYPRRVLGAAIRDQIAEAAAALPPLRKMHYAIKTLDFATGKMGWKFYRIDKPIKGKWAGRTFIDVQASDDYFPVRDPETVLAILQAVGFNAEKAASDYGLQIGKCGICRRTLTDPDSIHRGIGPVCASKAGW